MKGIKLSQGYVAIVDDYDYERVATHKWFAKVEVRADGTVRVYAMRTVRSLRGGRTTKFLHRFILDTPTGMHTDHINGNGLDNRRSNLRVCTNAENRRNQRSQTGRSSKFKGVNWHKMAAKWRAQVKVDGKTKHLGYFASEIDAARAYDTAALKYFGEFALLNDVCEAC